MKLSSQKHESIKEPRKNVVPRAGGLIVFIILLGVGGWYLFSLRKQSTPSPTRGTSDSPGAESLETAAEESPSEGVPEANAPGTPTPGFADDFDDSLGSNWTVHYGDPFIEDGRLTSKVGAGLAAGDASWENYQIEFDVDTSQVDCSFVDTSNSVGARVTDFDHAYWFVFTNCNSAWSFFVGGMPDLLPDTAVNTSNDVKHITLKVDETKMSAYENGSLISSITDTKFRTGGIFLQIEAQTYYDNFQVTLLP